MASPRVQKEKKAIEGIVQINRETQDTINELLDRAFDIFQPVLAKELIELYPELIYLENSEVVIDGVKYWGSPCTPTFGRNWAFNVDRGDDITKIWSQIPDDTNILITHGPPYKFGDKVHDAWYNPETNVGCKDLLERITELKELKIVTGGHIHSGHGIRYYNDKITIVNASLLDESYEYSYEPIILEI